MENINQGPSSSSPIFSLPQIFRLANKYPIPDFVRKTAFHDIQYTQESIPDHLYADPKRHKYPCHTPQATCLSAAQFIDEHDKIPDSFREYIVKNLIKHASEQNIEKEVLEILYHIDEQPEEIEYAFHKDGRDLFPIRNKKEAQVAIDYLDKYWDQIPSDEREQIAKNVLAIAAKKKFDLGNRLPLAEKLAGMAIISKNALSRIVKEAALQPAITPIREITKTDHKKLLNIIERRIQETTMKDQRQLRELLKAASDVIASFSPGIYKNSLEFMASTSFSELKSETDGLIHLENGKVYKKADLRNIPATVYQDWFGDDPEIILSGATCLTTHALCKKIATFNEALADRFTMMCDSLGIRPVLSVSRAITVPI